MPGPQRIADILSELMARRGYARVQSAEAFDEAWQQAAGALVAQHTRVGSLKRGTLEVIVTNSVLIQELGFQKAGILRTLNQLLPDQGIKNLRFRLGAIQ
jgi:predicted nucleic acid-binding Zn ribbon protein